MKIIHRINANNRPRFKDALDQLGLDYDYEESIVGKWVSFDIAEDDSLWPEIHLLVEEHGLGGHAVWTEFTRTEQGQANLLKMGPGWYNGYPLPSGGFEYVDVTYDTSEYCGKCGVGALQKGPFRVKAEPKWGSRHVMQLNWVYDEFFVRPGVWHDVFRPLGIGCRPVVKHSTGEQLKTVVQLDITDLASSPLHLEGYRTETCEVCGRIKYQVPTRGFFPPFVDEVSGDIFKLQEYFGSGGSGFRPVIISNRLYKEIKTRKLKGVEFKPLAKTHSNVFV